MRGLWSLMRPDLTSLMMKAGGSLGQRLLRGMGFTHRDRASYEVNR